MKDVSGYLKQQQSTSSTPEMAAEWHALEDSYNKSLFVLRLQKIIEEVEEMLNNLPGVTSVHGRFYDLSSKYYRIIGNHAAYYKDALRYLGCVDIKDLPETEKQERAFTLGLAGLLGEGVYNFGELLMHPVLETLRNTDKQWLIDTLYAFNAGNVEKFQGFKSAWGQQPDLAAHEPKLMQKIQLLCVMEVGWFFHFLFDQIRILL
ncbi:26S proteasome non-ATPase regulatory subunit 13 [Poecilia reticulata]|uniref:26S proteasome non-ATPase regulatory subunit 13 n=1 Tax=Poecilia reticulata TaxID=8081 RepID=UPI0007EB8890|nr:PREDICTED: 26S proteasome non-ATPase regulatory subunit 13 [Poecilia reticulata]